MKLASYLVLLLALVTSCNTADNKTSEVESAILADDVKPDILVLSDSVLIKEDVLNKPYFSVKILTTANTGSKGTYKTEVAWNKNTASSYFTMPESDKKLIPILRKVPDQYVYHVGFHYGEDTSFYDYYEIEAERGMIKMKYLKAYKFE